MGEWRYSSTIPILGTRWRRVVSFTLLPPNPGRKSRRYPPDRRRGGGVPEPVWTLWRIEKSLAPAVNLTPAVQPVARPTELSRLLYISILLLCTMHIFDKIKTVMYILD
jgi:hypothetical protein